MSVSDFINWSKNLQQKMKDEFYPRVEKRHVFTLGYIAEKSGHSRGSSIDFTIVPLPVPKQQHYYHKMKLIDCTKPKNVRFHDNTIDMGTGYDCMDPLF